MFWRLWFVVFFLGELGGPSSSAGFPEGVLAQAPSIREQAKEQKAVGDNFMKAGKRKEAEAAYRKAAELDPSWYEPCEALGNLLFSAQQYLEAVEAFEKALAADQRYVTGYYNIAFAYRKARKYQEAAEYYKKYLERNPNDPDAYFGLATTYESLGNKKGAMENYLQYIQKETRPSERQYVVKAKNKADELREALGVAAKPVAAPAAPPTEPKPTPSPAVASEPVVVAEKPVTRPPPAPVPAAPPKVTVAPETPKPAAAKEPDVAPAAEKPAPSTPAVASVTTKPATAPAEEKVKPEEQRKKLAALLAEGDRAMREKSHTLAMKAYFDAVKLDPNDTDALYKLGLVYQATGNQKAALIKWRNVLSIDPSHQGARRALQAAETQPADSPKPPPPTLAATRPEIPRPETPAPKVAAASEPAVEGKQAIKLVQQGDMHFNQKSFGRAIVSYTNATRLDPKNEEALFKLGVAYAMSGNFKVAVYKWEQVLVLNPNNESAKRNIERAKGKLVEEESTSSAVPPSAAKEVAPSAKAKSDLTAAGSVADQKREFEALMARARQLMKQGDPATLLEVIKKALKIEKKPEAWLLRGEALILLKRYQEAKRSFSKAMVLDPKLAAPFFGLGEACRLSGDQDRARYYFRMYVRSSATDINPALVSKAKAFLANEE